MNTPRAARAGQEISQPLIDDICARLDAGEAVHEELPGGVVLNFDRFLPFMCVHRQNPERADAGTASLVSSEATSLTVSGDVSVAKGLRRLIRALSRLSSRRFGAFFIIEVWSSTDDSVPQDVDPISGETLLPPPSFRVHERAPDRPGPAVDDLVFALDLIEVHARQPETEVVLQGKAHPPGLEQLLGNAEGLKLGCFIIGLEVSPIYRNSASGEVYPAVHRTMQRGIGRALRRSFFRFSARRTNIRPEHYFALGRRSFGEEVWEADRQLSQIGNELEFLLAVSPMNSKAAWRQFSEGGFSEAPRFSYRPLRTDPLLLKRSVSAVGTERIGDAIMADLLRETQGEMDGMVTMLSDVDTENFLPGSLQVFGGVEPELLQLAEDMLLMPDSGEQQDSAEKQFTPGQFVRRAQKDIKAYRKQFSGFAGTAEVREDMFSGLMVSSGNLLIGRETSIPASRVEALLAHEVGTHMVTFHNGNAQPLQLLSSGLAGYEPMQEGLAVLSEYLVGGLTRTRLRLLALRVLAVQKLLDGASFVETWRHLTDHKLAQATAFTITMRVYRGGGLTKDAVYLRGLVEILDYLGSGGAIELLFMGKLAIVHVPVIKELLLREVLHPAPLTPMYMSAPGTAERLARVRSGLTVLDLFPT